MPMDAHPDTRESTCELCHVPGGEILWRDERCRVVRVEGTEGRAFPGFCRVVWQAHVQEMSDLAPHDRLHLLEVVAAVELAVRAASRPDKINLASLGNVTPHLHWHVIPRWRDDSHFPAPVWATPARPVPERAEPESEDLENLLIRSLGSSR